jgi:proline dehydrogenase
MARNPWLRRQVPRLWFVRRALRRFMPGETLEDALSAADGYAPQRIGALFTHLGENLVDPAEADAVAAHYLDALEQIKARGIDGEISLKLTQLGLDLDPQMARRHLAALAIRARELGSGRVWIDMEGSDYTEATVALYEALLPDHPNLEQIGASAEAVGSPRDAYEVQMLYGIRTGELERLARAGYRSRVLIAYGEFWYPWYVRRLAERPANVTFVLRQLLPW